MDRRLAFFFVLVFPLSARAEGLGYAPPGTPTPPDPAGLLFRLVALLLAVLVLCAVLLYAARRYGRLGVANMPPSERLTLEGSLVIDRKCALHIIRADGHAYAVTCDSGGLRSILPLSEPFGPVLERTQA